MESAANPVTDFCSDFLCFMLSANIRPPTRTTRTARLVLSDSAATRTPPKKTPGAPLGATKSANGAILTGRGTAASGASSSATRRRAAAAAARKRGTLSLPSTNAQMLRSDGWLLHPERVEMCAAHNMPMQQSRALVFDGTNGVGKTFGALKLAVDIPEDLSDLARKVGIPLKESRRMYDIEAVYIVFSMNAGLSQAERTFLARSIDKETVMKQVLFTRLCLAVAKGFDTDAEKKRYGIVRTFKFSENDVTLAEDQLGSVPQFLKKKMWCACAKPAARSGGHRR